MVTENTESVNKNTEAFVKNKNAVDKLTTAFGKTVTGILQGAPKSFSDAAGPVLKAFGGAGDTIASVMAGAEAYVGVWRALTTRGINFGNELDTMSITAGRANLRLEDLATLAGENAQVFAQLGNTANQGINTFLSRQGVFLQATSGDFLKLRERLELLGMTTDTINERFLQYDAIANVNNIRSNKNDRIRNMRAAEFAEEMDKLSRLTGEQADALAAERADISRQGNIFAFAQSVDEQVRDEVAGTVQRLGKMGGTIGNLATDIITRGFPNPDDPAVMALHSFAPELVQTLHGIRAAAQAGNEAEAKRLQDVAVQQAAALRTNTDVLNMAILGGVNEYTQGLMNIVGDLNKSAEALTTDELVEKFKQQNPGQEATADALAKFRNELIKAEKDMQLTPGTTGGEKALNAYIDGLRTLQFTAATLQTETLKRIFTNIGDISELVAKQAEGVDVSEMVKMAINTSEGALMNLAPTIGMSDEEKELFIAQRNAIIKANELELAAESALANNNKAESDKLTNQAQEILKAVDLPDTTASAIKELISSANQSIASAIEADLVTINAQEVTIDPDMNDEIIQKIIEQLKNSNKFSTGTMGATGQLFKNFGKETFAALHGLEAVVTPSQMQDIVRNSAMGALQAAQASYADQGVANNGTAMLNGMLNTIKTTIVDGGANNNQANASLEALKTAIMNLPGNMRGPMEEALNNTLSQPLTQLVDTSKQNVDMSDRIRKGFTTLSGDYMRGA